MVVLAALENALQGRRQADGRPQGRHRRRRRRRRGHHQDPAWRPACPTIVGVDRKGAIYEGRDDLNVVEAVVRREHQPRAARRARSREVLPGADVFIGVSRPGPDHRRRPAQRWPTTRSCSPWPTPTPRSGPRTPRASPRSSPPAAATTRTRSTTCCAFPGIFRGALDAGATDDHRGHEAGRGRRHRRGGVRATSWRPDYIVPSVFDKRVVELVAPAGRRGRPGRGHDPCA